MIVDTVFGCVGGMGGGLFRQFWSAPWLCCSLLLASFCFLLSLLLALCFSSTSILPFSYLVLVCLSLFIPTFLGLGCAWGLILIRLGGVNVSKFIYFLQG